MTLFLAGAVFGVVLCIGSALCVFYLVGED